VTPASNLDKSPAAEQKPHAQSPCCKVTASVKSRNAGLKVIHSYFLSVRTLLHVMLPPPPRNATATSLQSQLQCVGVFFSAQSCKVIPVMGPCSACSHNHWLQNAETTAKSHCTNCRGWPHLVSCICISPRSQKQPHHLLASSRRCPEQRSSTALQQQPNK
jgi:hypothetical protein